MAANAEITEGVAMSEAGPGSRVGTQFGRYRLRGGWGRRDGRGV